ncbi:hypothetical protein [Streptomyces sp. NPDC046862]
MAALIEVDQRTACPDGPGSIALDRADGVRGSGIPPGLGIDAE